MPTQHEGDSSSRRPRANTTFASLSNLNWRRHAKAEPLSTPQTPATQTPPIISPSELIEALTPPAVPGPANARALANVLSSCAPLPRPAALNPVLASLCAPSSPATLQIAGYDIITAYWENVGATLLTTADRMGYFSLFLGQRIAWSQEMWEPRLRALRALTKAGSEIIGQEAQFLRILKLWIEGAFEALLLTDACVEQVERAERERCIEAVSAFLASVLASAEIVARVPEDELSGILSFYAGLLERSLNVPSNTTPPESSTPTSSDAPYSASSTPSRPFAHRRHPSSMSIPPSQMQAPPPPPPKHPAAIAVALYLDHLHSQLKTLPPAHLKEVLPLLFRALAFYASPLPRLALTNQSATSESPEDRITVMLNSLFTGPYTQSCMLILKRHLFPPGAGAEDDVRVAIARSTGAHRQLRNYIRRGLSTRLARAYINRESSVSYTPSGAPGHMDLEIAAMERAWPKDDFYGWDAAKLGRVLSKSIEAWIDHNFGMDLGKDLKEMMESREKILDEAAGTLKDILQELDMREDNLVMDDDESTAVGETLHALASYVYPLKNADESPFIIPLGQPSTAPTPFLRTLTSLLDRDHTMFLNPLLSTTLLSIADHLTDRDTAKLPLVMTEQHDLSPTSSEWLTNWKNILGNRTLLQKDRPLTRQATMTALSSVYDSVMDMPVYRRPLADLVEEFCRRQVSGPQSEDGDGHVWWAVLGQEAVLRAVEARENEDAPAIEGSSVEDIIDILALAASTTDEFEESDILIPVVDHSPSSRPSFSVGSSTVASPVVSRMQSEFHGQSKDKESTMPSVMSLLSSFTSATPSRSQSQHPREDRDISSERHTSPPSPSHTHTLVFVPRAVSAATALITVFSQMAFTPYALVRENVRLAVNVFRILLSMAEESKSARARLTILQFLMRLRADRDHRLYYADAGHDPDGHIANLASLIHRNGTLSRGPGEGNAESPEIPSDDKPRARPQERDGRRVSRGRGGRLSSSASSRSRSRATATILPAPVATSISKPREPIWNLPESLPFTISDVNTPSESLVSYHPNDPENEAILPISGYLTALVNILEKEKNWEILSYVLCHLPVQLANKHLFCGPKAREVVARLVLTLCTGLVNGDLAAGVDRWPHNLKARDAQGLAYHTLSVLISYKRCLDMSRRHMLVEVFERGLNGQPATIKCCLHALSLAAFELPSSMTKFLSRILEKLSQIMSNPDMAVHIIGFLSIVGSLRELHANFTEGYFKMVFGVALQYLQHHNRSGSSPTISWALSQHVRIMSYYLVYVWFLAVKLPDRPRHVQYITRQLLLANEGNDEIDEPTEVCFDWLARYTYASADPRPATASVLSDILMNPTEHQHAPPEIALSEKSWILGNSIVTIRALARLGWVEVVSRRPSGVTKFLCRVENVPLVSAGDVDPDMVSIPATLLLGHRPSAPSNPQPLDSESPESETPPPMQEDGVRPIFTDDGAADADKPPPPDPVTGYVWSGSAPSQRRKEVAIDPSFFALQLSSYPDSVRSRQNRRIADSTALPRMFRVLDHTPVIDTHEVGIMYVAPGQTSEVDILRNTHGSPAYTRFLEGIGRLIYLRGQVDVYVGRLDPAHHGDYAYAWWDDIGQVLYHTATMMPTRPEDPDCTQKKMHIGNAHVRIVWNDSGIPYQFDTLKTQFQFVNIVIEPHSLGAIAAFSNNIHENEYFKVTVQRAPGMTEFAPVGDFKLISAESLPLLVRQLSLLGDWFTSVFVKTEYDTKRVEMMTNWRQRLQIIKRFRATQVANDGTAPDAATEVEGIMAQQPFRDFTTSY
ncbi:hypothetical protein PLICRDRAFT_47047 [Plicaturopsis crispa FD-325 SS-3]|uniref:Rap-GAP domain-containing protein n=1 Tax=Plicaturopsis crispa FD-325 SS-3 TaxID=944288 RepID=A0A0C9T3H7_PLICR|nr:hypothetical protein PLICRDRAFT_47047 [Plicaturopsis crispa FD-325 SS-3]